MIIIILLLGQLYATSECEICDWSILIRAELIDLGNQYDEEPYDDINDNGEYIDIVPSFNIIKGRNLDDFLLSGHEGHRMMMQKQPLMDERTAVIFFSQKSE